jgi:hypothetical protein
MVSRKRSHASSVHAVLGLLLLGSYVGCFPDLDALSAGDDKADSGATSGSGGSGATSGSGGSGATSGSGGGTGGTGNTASGGTSGAAGDGSGGDAGDMGTGGGGGMGAEGGECSTDTDIGKPEGNTVTDCGECGVTCSLRNATRALCTEGACEPLCRSGFGDCTAVSANDGCETAITTPTNCGECGMACSLEHVATPNCTSGACAPACSPSYLDCNATTANDGCETSESATNCGACGYTCSTEHAVGASCNAGRCAPTCAPGWGNCNSAAMLSADDGCEVYLDSITACTAACGSTVVDCDATSVCNLGSCVAPQGVAVLSVPLSAAGQAQRYGNIFPGFPDLSNRTVTLRIYAPGATGGNLLAYFTDDPDFTAGGGGTVPLADLALGWTDLVFSVGSLSGAYDPTHIRQINLVVTSENTAGPWTNPTVIYVDSVRSSNLIITDTFNAGTPLQGAASVQNMAPSTQQTLAGSTLTWSDSVP